MTCWQVNGTLYCRERMDRISELPRGQQHDDAGVLFVGGRNKQFETFLLSQSKTVSIRKEQPNTGGIVPTTHIHTHTSKKKKKKKKKPVPPAPASSIIVWVSFHFFFIFVVSLVTFLWLQSTSIIIRLHGLHTYNLSALVAFLSESQIIELFRPIGFFIV